MTRKRMYYDIEVSYVVGSFWRAGYNQTILPQNIIEYAKIICISWKWEGSDVVHNLDWGLKKQCDKKLLKKFIKELDRADELVSHNGMRFDIKWIRGRALVHGIPMRNNYIEIDTLKIAKSLFNLPSYKLGEIAKYLGLEAKGDPGGLSTWDDIILRKDSEALERMKLYCNQDVVVLEQVHNRFKEYSKPKLNYATLHNEDNYYCPECATDRVGLSKTYTTTQGTIRHNMKCRHCKTMYVINNKSYENLLTHRMRNNIK